jgi:hypothetical protein
MFCTRKPPYPVAVYIVGKPIARVNMPNKRLQEKSQRRRMGRPAGPVTAARRNRVVTLVTDAEFEELTSIAEAENRSLSAVVHQILKNHLAQRS